MKRLTFLICIAFLSALGCNRRAPGNNDRDVTDAFGIVNQDAILDMSSAQNLKPKLQTDDKGQVTIKTRNWLDTSNRMFAAAEALGGTGFYQGRLQLIKTGHELSQALYFYPNTTTSMTPGADPVPGNPFLEEAYFYVKDVLNTQYQTTMSNTAKNVTLASRQVTVKRLAPPKNDDPVDINAALDVPTKALEDFIKNMRALDDPTTKEATDEISAQIQKEDINELIHFKSVLAMKDPRETASNYVSRLQTTIKQTALIPDSDKATALKALPTVMYFAGKVDLCTTAENTMQIFVDLWNANDNRTKFPPNVKLAVANAFKPFKDTDVIAMIDSSREKLVKSKIISEDDAKAVLEKRTALTQTVLSDPETLTYAKTLTDPPGKTDQAVVFEALVNAWYNMEFRSNLFDITQLWGFSENDLLLIRDVRNHLAPPLGTHPLLAVKRKVILDTLNRFNTAFPNSSAFQPGIDWFKGYVNYKIIQAIHLEISNAIMDVAESIPDKIRDTILEKLKGLKLSSRANVWDLFKKFSAQYLKKWIFDDKATLPLLEKNVVRFQYQDRQLVPLPSSPETSGEVLGMSFSNAVGRLSSLDYVDLKPDQPGVRAVAFQSLCKLAALMGYMGIDNKPVPSLMTPFSTGKKATPLDLAHYDPDKSAFAAADLIPITNNYKLKIDANSNRAWASVAGQMELLMGLTKMIRYLKPWNPTSFDIGLANLRIDEFPAETVFAKSTFFLQSLGLASTIIKNIPARMVALLTLDGGIVPLGQVKDLSSLELGGVVLTDFGKDTISHVVRSHDIALAVIALNDFFDAIGDLSRSSDPSVRSAAAAVEEQRPLIEKLFLGISMFSLSKLMASDGGFVTSYNLDSQTPSNSPRVLEDQLLMEEALLIIGNLLNRNFIRLRAIDNFFFLNSRFWNDHLGFYKNTEFDPTESLNLGDVSEAIKNTVLIKPLLTTLAAANPTLQPSLRQLESLQSFWLNRFFGEKVSDLPAVLKLGQFIPSPNSPSNSSLDVANGTSSR